MQFFLFDVVLAFAALLGYRTLAAVVQHRAPLITREGRIMPPRVAIEPKVARSKKLAVNRAPRSDRPVVPIHRLINFW